MAGDRCRAQSHGVMYYDGRHKICVYQGTALWELYDLKKDPGEFDNLWDVSEWRRLKAELIGKAFDAYLATSSAGIQRTHRY